MLKNKRMIFGLVILTSALILYSGVRFQQASIQQDLLKCQNWYNGSFQGWKDFKIKPQNERRGLEVSASITSEQKESELNALEPAIKNTIANACSCLMAKSDLFREQVAPKMLIEDAATFENVLSSEIRKYKVECGLPDFFTWKAEAVWYIPLIGQGEQISNDSLLDAHQDFPIEHPMFRMILPKGWSARQIREIAEAETLSLSPSRQPNYPTFLKISRRYAPMTQSLDAIFKKYSTKKDRKVSYQTIDGQKWIHLTELANENGHEVIIDVYTTIRDKTSWLFLVNSVEKESRLHSEAMNRAINSFKFK